PHKDFARDRLGLGHAIDVVAENSGVSVDEAERGGAYIAALGSSRSSEYRKRNRVERRPAGGTVELPAVSRRSRSVSRDDQPHRRTIQIVGKPGGDDRVALVHQIDPPPRFGA